MKRLIILSLLFWPLLSMAQDDMYFVPSKKKVKAAEETVDLTPRAEAAKPAAVVVYNDSHRSEDEYNRRYVGDGGYVADSLRADSIAAYEDYEDDPEEDFRYSRRLVRFHSPRLYAIASPYYWDLYYAYGAWDYLYDPYDPWYWHYGWGYGWSWGPWDCWYGGIWGYTYPHHWAYWGWGPCWHAPIHGVVHYRNTVPREFNSSRGHMAANNRLRSSAIGRLGNAASSSGRTSSRMGGSVGTASSGRGVRSESYTDYVNQRSGRISASASAGSQPMAAHEAAQRHGRRNAEEEWDSLCALSLTKTAAAGQGAHVLTVSALRHLLHHALRHVTTIIPDRAALAARPLPIALLRAAHLVASVEAVLEAVHQVAEAVHAVADVKVLHPTIPG